MFARWSSLWVQCGNCAPRLSARERKISMQNEIGARNRVKNFRR